MNLPINNDQFGKAFIYWPNGESMVLENVKVDVNGYGKFTLYTHATLERPFDPPVYFLDKNNAPIEYPSWWVTGK